MATTKNGQFSVTASGGGAARTGPRLSVLLLGGGGLALLAGGAASFTRPGMAALAAVHWFLEFYSGVFSLVALSLTVMGGLASTDRIILLIRHRVLLQAVHRGLATTAMVFLVIHISLKVAEAHASVLDVVVPFVGSHRVIY